MTEQTTNVKTSAACATLTGEELRRVEGGDGLVYSVSQLLNPAIQQAQTMQYILQKYGMY
jgi:hypothetical protein